MQVDGRAEVLDLPDAASRDAYLDSACAGDPEQRARIDALLRSHELSAIQQAGGQGSTLPSTAVIIIGAITIVSSLYWWLLSPLEEHH